MKIDWIRLTGFRNFKNEKIHFAKQTLIIGENDVGKTNLVYALRLLFDKSLSDQDLDLLPSDYNVYEQSKEIKITVKISEITEDCLITVFKGSISENEEVFIQYQNSLNGEYHIFIGPSENLLEEKSGRFYIRRLNMEYVNTNRDLKRFVEKEKNNIFEESKDALSDTERNKDSSDLEEIQKKMKDINDSIDSLNYVDSALKKVNSEMKLISTNNVGQQLRFRNKNSDITKMLRNSELTYETSQGTLTLGGTGRKNQIFLATWVAEKKNNENKENVTFYAVEEPESHLHPQQQRKMSNYLLNEFNEQIFITTHSPYIASDFKPNKIVKLYSEKKLTKAAQAGCNNNLKTTFDEFGYRLNIITSDIFFVNGIFLVEGPSEKMLYTELAKSLNIDLDALNISILSVDGVGFLPYIKICIALNIPFTLRTDNDIFDKKTKDGKIHDYYSGVSRIMKYYNCNEIVFGKNRQKIQQLWNALQSKNEWDSNTNPPEEAIDLHQKLEKLFNEDGIFLSKKDLENDLVASPLNQYIKEYYYIKNNKNIQNDTELVKYMQKRKAEFMFSFLETEKNKLIKLKNNNISCPLFKINSLVEKNDN